MKRVSASRFPACLPSLTHVLPVRQIQGHWRKHQMLGEMFCTRQVAQVELKNPQNCHVKSAASLHKVNMPRSDTRNHRTKPGTSNPEKDRRPWRNHTMRQSHTVPCESLRKRDWKSGGFPGEHVSPSLSRMTAQRILFGAREYNVAGNKRSDGSQTGTARYALTGLDSATETGRPQALARARPLTPGHSLCMMRAIMFFFTRCS